MDWLRQELKSIPTYKPIMIVSHIPILAACIFLMEIGMKKSMEYSRKMDA